MASTIMPEASKISNETGLAFKERLVLFQGKQTVGAEKKYSNWDICLQILFGDDSPEFNNEKDRSLKSILKNNQLLHSLAEDCFPDRQGLELILRGGHSSDERVRKILILLLFYEFWVNQAIKNKDGTYMKAFEDGIRCKDIINNYLIEAGYPMLYYGNPFDWLFLHAIQDDCPLATFRYFMWELCCAKNEAQI